MSAAGALPPMKAPAPLTGSTTVPRRAVRIPVQAVEAKTYLVHGTRGTVRLLMVVRCPCGSTHVHTTAFLNFGEGVRKAGCGLRYLVRVAAARQGAA